MNFRIAITFTALAALLVLAACSQATPDPKNLTDPFFLDTYSSSGIPMVVGPVLEENGLYSVTVEGTHSSWTVDEWALGVCQGTPETLPMFETPGVWNGRVGMDAVWVFAAPNGSSRCGTPMPFRGSGVRISLDGGSTFTDLSDITGGTGPSEDHLYEYEVTGAGKALVMNRASGSPNNNYGMLRVQVREVAR